MMYFDDFVFLFLESLRDEVRVRCGEVSTRVIYLVLNSRSVHGVYSGVLDARGSQGSMGKSVLVALGCVAVGRLLVEWDTASLRL